ncbi:MAG TPA: valine--tRNA ligase, partial [Chromatiales bacterium]|nr:valine--tRNA ligase [Chromatiales bacterium]
DKYRGLDRYEARRRIVEDLEVEGLLEKVEDHRLMVPRGDRSHAVVEPYLTDQWYVKIAPLAEPAIRAVEDGRIHFVPENWSKTYFEWMHNIQDWCISRQLWWGHRIPAWYDEAGNVYVGHSEAEVREKNGLGDIPLVQDEDVLDTWFSSALWPFSTLGWPERTPELETFYPTSVLVTGFDIIFFWVARMIMMGLKFMGDVPFREVYIHGLVRDAHGQKMSKSKGNVLDPIDLIDGIDLEALVKKRTTGLMQPQMAKQIEEATRREFPKGIPAFGTDALRFTFAALASTGRDIKFDLKRIEGYRNFCNKIWNAARYVLMNTEGHDTGLGDASITLSLPDRWIRSRLQAVIDAVREQLEQYRFDLAAQALYDFIWHDYCDWYLELSKPVLNDPEASEAAHRGTRQTLVRVLEHWLRLLHPFMPFITEEIWQRVRPLAGTEGETIMLAPWPASDEAQRDPAAEREIEWLQQFIMGLRRIRAEMDIAPRKPLPVLIQGWTERDRERYRETRPFIEFLARPESITWLEPNEQPPESATALVGDMKLLIPLAGLIDTEAELARLDKEINKLRQQVERAQKKLANDGFVRKAPPTVVEKERVRLREHQRALAELEAQAERIRAL